MNFVRINLRAIVSFLRFQFVGFILVLWPLAPAKAQQAKFTTVASSKEIGRQDYVQIEFIVENAKQIEHLTPPAFPDFHVVEGPMQSSGMSIVNGSMSQYKGISFVLQPNKMGSFTIPGATADVDGKPMRSNTITIAVTTNNNGNSANAGPATSYSPMPYDPFLPESGDYVLKPNENMAEKTKKNLFVKLQVSKSTCYVGEPIVASYKLYSRLRSESKVAKYPSLNGFSVYDMVDPGSDASTVETVNGKPFSVHIIRKAQLIPLQPGQVELSPVEVENTVHYLKQSKKPHQSSSLLQDLFDQFGEEGAGEEIQQHVTLDSKPLLVTVKPLPADDKLTGFNGAVGHFSIGAALDKKNMAAQDAVTLKLTITGSGNLPVIDAPQVNWPANVDIYGTTAKEDIDKTVVPMKGSKTFEYVFMPKAVGSYTIPAIGFSYFDPVSDSYKTVKSQALDFNVSIAKKHSSPPLPKNVLSATQNENFLSNIKSFIVEHLELIFSVAFLSTLSFFLWKHNKKSLEKEKTQKHTAALENARIEAEMAKAKLPAEVADPLLRTKRLLENGDYKGFYAELNRAIWAALYNKLNLPASELNKHNISLRLKAKGWDETTICQLENILNQCEMNLYTPGYNPADMGATLQSTERIIKYINEV
ncbi:MAG: protein BatD [Bacteroidetes bacterium]|nr:protein BatD [Bacteroidota bacterium]